ncbi:MAG: hypothetical protein SFW66_01425 [Gammaproteobacteria bacterium]|nr:hypothetical protein [Gammaproteobacteria bacterium]
MGDSISGAFQSVGSWLWTGAKYVGNAVLKIPGASIVTARAGSSAFNVFRFIEWISRNPNASKSTGALIAATFAAAGSAGTNIVTRYFNVNRNQTHEQTHDQIVEPEEDLATIPENWVSSPPTSPSSHQHIIQALSNDEEQQFNLEESKEEIPDELNEDNETWLYTTGRVLLQLNNFWYMLGSGLSSFISMGAIVQLIASFAQTTYDGECDENESVWWKIAIVYLFTAVQMYANVKSFASYTIPLSNEYYHELVTQTPSKEDVELKKLHWGNYFNILVSSILESINTFFGTTYLIQSLENGFFCNMAKLFGLSNPHIPAGYGKGFAVLWALTTFVSNLVMTSGAQQRVNKSAHDSQPVFGYFEEPIQMCVLINSLQAALGSSVALATLPAKLAGMAAESAYLPGIIVLAIIVALIKFKTNYALDQAGVDRERRYRLQFFNASPTDETVVDEEKYANPLEEPLIRHEEDRIVDILEHEEEKSSLIRSSSAPN